MKTQIFLSNSFYDQRKITSQFLTIFLSSYDDYCSMRHVTSTTTLTTADCDYCCYDYRFYGILICTAMTVLQILLPRLLILSQQRGPSHTEDPVSQGNPVTKRIQLAKGTLPQRRPSQPKKVAAPWENAGCPQVSHGRSISSS